MATVPPRPRRSLRPRQAAEFLGIGTATLWRWIAEKPDFPQPKRPSRRVTLLDEDELVAWRDKQGGAAA